MVRFRAATVGIYWFAWIQLITPGVAIGVRKQGFALAVASDYFVTGREAPPRGGDDLIQAEKAEE
jgi:hypothetical protein